MYVDSHCHLTFDELFQRKEDVLRNMEKVSYAMIMCTNEEEFQRALIYKKEDPKRFKIAWGWHPQDANAITEDHLIKLQKALDQHQLDCLGEIGLDYYWDSSFKERQKELLIRQLHMANQAGLPVSIHMRNATLDTLSILKQHAKTPIIFHCFSGSKETMKECLKMDSMISFAGPITFKNARKNVLCVKECPIDRILSETDSPFLTPVPFRGQKNEPMYVEYVTKKICEIKQLALETVCSQIQRNFLSLF